MSRSPFFSLSRSLSGSAALLVGLAATAPALAGPELPGIVQSHLGMDAAPPCAVCHTTGTFPADTPFALALKAAPYGFVRVSGQNSEDLPIALAAMEADGVDADGNGVPDITDITGGVNPRYGCSLAPSESTPSSAGAQLLAAAALLVGARRRRKSSQRS